MIDEAPLDLMVRGLAAMPPPRRQIVLAALNQSERERLRQYVTRAGDGRLSSALARLIDQCRAGDTSLTISPLASDVLLSAAQASAKRDGLEEALDRLQAEAPARRGLFARRTAFP